MPERLSEVAAQIHNVRQLTAVVSQAIGEALNLLPTAMSRAPAPVESKRALILFCAEQGFAGAFSERVFEAAGSDLETAVILLVGTRGAAVAGERGIKPAWSTAMTTRVEGIAAFANRLAEALYRYVAHAAIAGPILSSHALSPEGCAWIGIRCCRSTLDGLRDRWRESRL